MLVSVNDLKIIASNGGGMILDARIIPVNDLKIIVSNASSSGAKIILKIMGAISANDLKVIASNSKGCTVFDFCGS